MQKRNTRMIGNPQSAEATVAQKTPFAAAFFAETVSSATWPEASSPTRQLQTRYQDKTQLRLGFVSPPLYVEVKTNSADWNPYVLDTPIGNQMKLRHISIMMTMTPARKTHL
jgi:hypothetical protein